MTTETVRKVWLLWWTGWDSAPPLVKECAASWIEQNPTWTVQLLDRRTVYRHINITLPPAQWAWMKRKEQPAASDLVRLALMAQRGGVYADATEYCLQPLDAWVHRMLRRSTGFVGSREWDASKNRLLEASNWMAAARPGHPVARAWLEYALEYWRARQWGPPCEAPSRRRPAGCAFHYFFMDDLFGQIWREHAAVRALHAGNGYVHPHQSALYFRGGGGANRMWQNRSLETARRFGAGASLEQPYYVKLTHRWTTPAARACLAAIERHDPRSPSPLRWRATPLAADDAAACEALNGTNVGFVLLAGAAGRLPSPPQRHPMLANAIDVTSDKPGPPLCFGALCMCRPQKCAWTNCTNPVHCIGAAAADAAWGRVSGAFDGWPAASTYGADDVPLRCELRAGTGPRWALKCGAELRT